MSTKPETALIRQIVEYLEYRGAVVTRVNAGLRVIQAQGGDDKANRRVFRGAEKGTSDVIGCYRGRYFAIEAKVAPNKTTAAQDNFLEKVRAAGGIACVAYNLDDIDQALGIAPYRIS